MSLENLENQEQQVEGLENQVEDNEQRMEEVNNRLDQIEQAMQELTEDQEIANTVGRNKEQAEQDKQQIQGERDQIEQQLEGLNESVGEMTAENEESAAVLDGLREIGEDVSEADEIIEHRRGELQNFASRIQELRDRLKQQG